MNILITGANGFIGHHLVSALAHQGHQIIAGFHHQVTFPHNSTHVNSFKCDFKQFSSPSDWFEKLKNIDVVINTVGIISETPSQQFKCLHQNSAIALFKACENANVKKIIQISALGADNTAISQFHRSKKVADDFLKTLKLNWVIILPSIVYGSGAKSLNLFKPLAALPITPLLENGNQKIQPIHINDFCKAITKLVSNESISNIEMAFVGPEAISMRSIYVLLKQWLTINSCRFVEIPFIVMILTSKIFSLLHFSIISTDSLKMLQQGNTADVAPFVNLFGFTPQSFSDYLHYQPALQADRWHLKLLVLKPILRLSIAFIWIFTAIVSLFIYPKEDSYHLLQQLMIPGNYAALILYSAATIDLVLGVATLINFRLKLIGIIQILIIIAYTILISLFLPEQWLHPFGAISKNIPLIVAIIIMIVLHDKKWR